MLPLVLFLLIGAVTAQIGLPAPYGGHDYLETCIVDDLDAGEFYKLTLECSDAKEILNLDEENPLLYEGNLTMSGKPVEEFSVCLWVRINKRIVEEYLAVIQPFAEKFQEVEDKNNFHFLAIGVSKKSLTIYTRNCIFHYSNKVVSQDWTHICVSMNDTLSTFFNGEKVMSSNNCSINGSVKYITASENALTLGSHPFIDGIVYGNFADVRLYSQTLEEDDASRIFTSDFNDLPFISAISPDCVPPNSCISKGTISRNRLRPTAVSDRLLYISDVHYFEDALTICESFGGEMLTTTYIKQEEEYLRNYLMNILEKFIIEIFVNDDKEGRDACAVLSGNVLNIMLFECKAEQILGFICLISGVTEYKSLSASESCNLYFIGWKNSFVCEGSVDITFQDKIAMINNYHTKDTLFILGDHVLPSMAMGRKTNWISIIHNNASLSMTISSCSTYQFTCTSGQCIDLTKACDYVIDCLDFSDEQLCNATENRPEFYLKYVSGANPLKVDTTLTLNRIINVDMTKDTVQISLNISVTWNDQRLTFHSLNAAKPTFVSPEDAAFFWQPDIQFTDVLHNEASVFSLSSGNKEPLFLTSKKNGTPSVFDHKEVLFYEGKDVEMKAIISNVITLDCKMNLLSYPFDKQTCLFSIYLRGKVNPDSVWGNFELISNNDAKTDPLYTFENFEGRLVNVSHGNKIKFQLTFSRIYASQILMMFLPCIIIQIIGMSVFAIPLTDLSSRLTVSVSCLIVMATLFTQTSSTLPVSATSKIVDYYMFIHVMTLGVIFVLLLVINAVFEWNNVDNVEVLQQDRKIEGWLTKLDVPMAASKKEHYAKRLNKVLAVSCMLCYLIVLIGFVFITYKDVTNLSENQLLYELDE